LHAWPVALRLSPAHGRRAYKAEFGVLMSVDGEGVLVDVVCCGGFGEVGGMDVKQQGPEAEAEGVEAFGVSGGVERKVQVPEAELVEVMASGGSFGFVRVMVDDKASVIEFGVGLGVDEVSAKGFVVGSVMQGKRHVDGAFGGGVVGERGAGSVRMEERSVGEKEVVMDYFEWVGDKASVDECVVGLGGDVVSAVGWDVVMVGRLVDAIALRRSLAARAHV
jgi:hypothetical protein